MSVFILLLFHIDLSITCGRENNPTRGFSFTYCLTSHERKMKMFLLTHGAGVVYLTMLYHFRRFRKIAESDF